MTQPKPPSPKPRTSSDQAETAFTTWLNRGLHELYDDIANEPIPDELLRLIRDDQNK